MYLVFVCAGSRPVIFGPFLSNFILFAEQYSTETPIAGGLLNFALLVLGFSLLAHVSNRHEAG